MSYAVPFKPLSKHDVAETLGVSVRTVENWVSEGQLHPPVKLGNRVYWHPNVFYAWLDRRLSADAATVETVADAERVRRPMSGKSKAAKLATARNEHERLRSRTQRQLDDLNV